MPEEIDYRQHGFLLPSIDADSQEWWKALLRHELILHRCQECGRASFPPSPGCPYCGSASFTWIEASGRGTVYSWVVVNLALHPAFTEDAPYTIVAVDLEEGPRIFGRLLPGVEPSAGMPLRARFYPVNDSVLVGFEPLPLD